MIERRSVPENKHYVAVKAADLDRLEAEIERLRAALQKIAAIENQMVGPDWEEIDQAREIAKAALGGEGKDG